MLVQYLLSATRQYCVKMAKGMITQTTPRDSTRNYSFLTPTAVGGRRPIPPQICAQSDPPSFRTLQFRPISACSISTVRAREKVQVALINEP